MKTKLLYFGGNFSSSSQLSGWMRLRFCLSNYLTSWRKFQRGTTWYSAKLVPSCYQLGTNLTWYQVGTTLVRTYQGGTKLVPNQIGRTCYQVGTKLLFQPNESNRAAGVISNRIIVKIPNLMGAIDRANHSLHRDNRKSNTVRLCQLDDS